MKKHILESRPADVNLAVCEALALDRAEQPRQQGLQQRPHFKPRHMRPDAVMPAEPKGKMGIRAAVDPELVRVREDSLVTIGGIEK